RRSVTTQPEPFNHVHVETEAARSLNSCIPHGSHFAGLRIHQNHLSIRSRDCFIAIRGVQAVRSRYARNPWIGDLCVTVEVENAIREFRNLADVLRYGSDKIRLGLNVADRLRPGCRGTNGTAGREAQRRSGIEVHNPAELPFVDDLMHPSRSISEK